MSTPARAATLEAPSQPHRAPLLWSAAWRAVREDLPVAMTISSGIFLTIAFGAWSTLGSVSVDLLIFMAAELCQGIASVLAQLAVLRWVPASQVARPGRLVLRVLLATAVGLPIFYCISSVVDLTNHLGLSSGDAWRNPFLGWVVLWISVVLVLRDEGRQREGAAAERLRQLQAEQLAGRRRLVEAQLQAVQARVDPQLFFDTLDAAERLYRQDPPRAEALLEALITFLRAALPRLQAPSSSLAQELVLAQSYVTVRALAGADVSMLEVDIPSELTNASFPSGVLLPLLTGALAASPSAVRLELKAWREPLPQASARLTLSLGSQLDLPPNLLAGIATTLRSLYGSAAAISTRHPGPGHVDTRISVPHEPQPPEASIPTGTA